MLPHYHGFTALYLPAPATLPCGTRGWARAPGETMAPGPCNDPSRRLGIHFTGPAAPVSTLGAPDLGAGPPPAQTEKDNSGFSGETNTWRRKAGEPPTRCDRQVPGKNLQSCNRVYKYTYMCRHTESSIQLLIPSFPSFEGLDFSTLTLPYQIYGV